MQKKVSASAPVVIDYVFHKILNTHKGWFTEKLHWKFLIVYTSIGSINSAFLTDPV